MDQHRDMDKLSLFALHSVPGMGSAMLRRLIARFGSAERVIAEATRLSLAQVPRMRREMIDGILGLPERMGELRDYLASVENRGYGMATAWDEGPHARLAGLRNAPAILYRRGEWPAGRWCAIVGTTQPSPPGRDMAEAMAARLATQGWVVVSGLARGVDTAAHLGALAAGGSTVMCIPTGVEQFRLWPALMPYESELGRRAVVVSEFFPSGGWAVARAMARNRLVAGMSDALVVVEAEREGGTMATFRMARKANVPTFAVQYDRPAEGAEGNALAIEQGATPLTCVDDVSKIVAAPARQAGPEHPTLW